MQFSSWIVTFVVLVVSALILALPYYIMVNNGYTDNDHSNMSWALFVLISSLAQQGKTAYQSQFVICLQFCVFYSRSHE